MNINYKEFYNRVKEESGYSLVENKVLFELNLQGRNDFKRQYPIEKFFADFYFPDDNIVLEIDGSAWHSSPEQVARDIVRDKIMNSLGFCVVRVKATVAYENPAGVLNAIKYFHKPKTYMINSEEDVRDILIARLNRDC